MKKWSIVIIFSISFVAAFLWGGYQWLSSNNATMDIASKEVKATSSEQKDLVEKRKEIAGTITEEDLDGFKEHGLNPFGEQTEMTDLTDDMYQEYIHGMSHQKVKANKKWGFYEIHPDRIEWLLEGLDKVNVKHADVYRSILEKWRDGNFAQAAEDHNLIWNLQDGTVGKATGILSKEEEQVYVEENAD
jgi:hypothetical protein